MTNKILDENRVMSLIHTVAHYLRAATHKRDVKKAETDYYTMAGDTVEAIITAIQNRGAKTALVIDDIGLQVVNRLYQEGIKVITLVLARVPADCFAKVKYMIMRTFPNIKVDIITLEETKNMKVDLVIANPPYGKIGADITKTIIDNVKYKEFINLEPGNDYFTNDLYKYVDPNFAPVVLGTDAFSDANQATTISKLLPTENTLTPTGARLLLSVRNDDKKVYDALKELWLNTETMGYLKFTQSKKDLAYETGVFVFNPGAFDINHGYFAVAQRDKWTSSTEYNIYHKDAIGHINLPKAKVAGCDAFIKLVYSELGLKMFKLWFTSSPEGWGFANGMFANIDYSNCTTWNDVFDKLNISKANQEILIEAADKFDLNKKELEICKIVKENM